jgi:hypothetical protein
VSSAKTSNDGPSDLPRLLGKAARAWAELRTFLDALDGVTSEWKFYGEKHGWQLKVVAKKRALLYLIPRQGHFTAAAALREAAIAALRAAGFPEERVREIEHARGSTEGKPARVDVSTLRDLGLVKQLVSIKLSTLS